MEKIDLFQEELINLFQDYFDNFSYYELKIAILNINLSKINRMLEISRSENLDYNLFRKDCFTMVDFEFSSLNFKYEQLERSLKNFRKNLGENYYLDTEDYIINAFKLICQIHNLNDIKIEELICSFKNGFLTCEDLYAYLSVNLNKNLFNALTNKDEKLSYMETRKTYYKNLKNAYNELINMVLEIIPEDYLEN